jgi:hypothetical protein
MRQWSRRANSKASLRKQAQVGSDMGVLYTAGGDAGPPAYTRCGPGRATSFTRSSSPPARLSEPKE